MDFDTFLDQLRGSVGTDIPANARPSLRLHEDLGLDSFTLLELLVVVEDMVGGEVAAGTSLPDLQTLGDFFSYFEVISSAAS